MIFDAVHGVPLGLADAMSITKIRTGAVSGVATDLLALKGAKHLALIGAGAQAYSHMEAIALVRKLELVTVYDTVLSHAEDFKQWAEVHFHVPVRVCANVQDAVRESDIICTLTPSREPYLEEEWIHPGCHINAVGAFTPTARELTSKLVAHSALFADSIEAMKQECGEFLIPRSEGLIEDSHIRGTLGMILSETCDGRKSEEEITIFDALGMAIEDVTCAKIFCE